MCGGTLPDERMVELVRGLSPRVRGNQRKLTVTIPARGTIPACAGEPPALEQIG